MNTYKLEIGTTVSVSIHDNDGNFIGCPDGKITHEFKNREELTALGWDSAKMYENGQPIYIVDDRYFQIRHLRKVGENLIFEGDTIETSYGEFLLGAYDSRLSQFVGISEQETSVKLIESEYLEHKAAIEVQLTAVSAILELAQKTDGKYFSNVEDWNDYHDRKSALEAELHDIVSLWEWALNPPTWQEEKEAELIALNID